MTAPQATMPAWPSGGHDQLERDLLDRWKEEHLFDQVQNARRSAPSFVFFEGPPTANGRPGIHHVFSRTIKDLFCRYQSALGHSVTRIAGWDTHGLPVEIEVEKKLKISGKKDIEAYGVEAFNQLCRESVFRYQSDWVALSDRIGYWLDYEHPYITCAPEYVESVWSLLRRLFDRSLLVRGHRVLPYCPRCGTVLSSHELSLGYEEVRDKSVYVTFPLTDGSGRELVVWTTTPWTLPANVAVAVHAELEYGTYRMPDGRLLVTAVSRHGVLDPPGKKADASGPELVKVELGSALVGLGYDRPLDIVPLPADKKHSVVIAGDFVTADDGSGLVHQAPAFGADDYAAGQHHGLAMVRPVAADGTFTGTTWPELEGRLVTADETNELIIRKLKTLGRHFKTDQHVHSYPHCWRCKSKLIYYARDSWFVRTSAIKDRMVELNRGINWQPPEVGAGRFGEWLANNVDWALSRDRYWGTPLPVWVSDQDPNYVEVIGSFAELEQKIGRPLPTGFDPHKPFIDEYTWAGPDGSTMRRVPEVIDTWFDSGAMPYAQWHYPFEGKAEFERHFPADFICEGVDQTRGWFYSLLAIGATAFDVAPYRNVVVNELVLDAHGLKMSKSRGNTVDPWKMIEEFGADLTRLYLLASSQVWLPKPFDPAAIPEVAGGFLNTLKNTYSFLALYAGGGETPPVAPDNDLDRWIVSRMASTTAAVRAAWSGYDATTGVRAIIDFVVDDLSNWYVRQSRSRFWAPDQDADPAAVSTLSHCLVTVARLMAPAAPFASDWLHRALTGTSVHLADFPVADPAAQDGELEQAMDAARRLASLARAAREAGNLRVRQALAGLKVAVPSGVPAKRLKSLLELVAREVNVRSIEIVTSDAELVRLKAKPNFRSLGKRFGKRTPEVAAAVQGLPADELRGLEAGRTVVLALDGEMLDILPDDVTVEREVTSDWLVQSAGGYVAAVNPALTPELVSEGLARELINRVQRLRKEAGYQYTTRIQLSVMGPADVLDAAETHRGMIERETLAKQVAVGTALSTPDGAETVDLDGRQVGIAVTRWHAG